MNLQKTQVQLLLQDLDTTVSKKSRVVPCQGLSTSHVIALLQLELCLDPIA